MVFSGAVFLYAFLPLTLAVYALAPQRGRNAVLLIASLLFYAFGEPVYVFLLLLSSVSNWALSLCIERRRGTRTAKLALAVSVLLNLRLLGFFQIRRLLPDDGERPVRPFLPLTGVRLPLGISFYTFQTMSYTIDVYRGHVRPQRNLATFGSSACSRSSSPGRSSAIPISRPSCTRGASASRRGRAALYRRSGQKGPVCQCAGRAGVLRRERNGARCVARGRGLSAADLF